jgi:hypothetical protein
MILKRQILLKAVVTEKLKAQLVEDLEEAIQQKDGQLSELERQSRRIMLELQRTDLNRAMAFRQQLDLEKRKHEDEKAELQEGLKETQGLELGTEIARTVLEGEVEVKVGDNLVEKLAAAEILVQDDVIKEIRDPAKKPVAGTSPASKLILSR